MFREDFNRKNGDYKMIDDLTEDLMESKKEGLMDEMKEGQTIEKRTNRAMTETDRSSKDQRIEIETSEEIYLLLRFTSRPNLLNSTEWGFGVLGFWGFGEIGRAHV